MLDDAENVRAKAARKAGQPAQQARLPCYIKQGPRESWALTHKEFRKQKEDELLRYQYPETSRERQARQGSFDQGLAQLYESIIEAVQYDTTVDEIYSAFLDATYSEDRSTQDIVATAMHWYDQRDPLSEPKQETVSASFLIPFRPKLQSIHN